jgi:hypothetical protein
MLPIEGILLSLSIWAPSRKMTSYVIFTGPPVGVLSRGIRVCHGIQTRRVARFPELMSEG